MDQHQRPNAKRDGVMKPLTAQERLFVETQNQCALCGSALQIRVETYLDDYYLREEAACPVCQIKTRVKNHKMH